MIFNFQGPPTSYYFPLLTVIQVHGVEETDQGPSGAKKPNEGPNADTMHSEDTSGDHVEKSGGGNGTHFPPEDETLIKDGTEDGSSQGKTQSGDSANEEGSNEASSDPESSGSSGGSEDGSGISGDGKIDFMTDTDGNQLQLVPMNKRMSRKSVQDNASGDVKNDESEVVWKTFRNLAEGNATGETKNNVTSNNA